MSCRHNFCFKFFTCSTWILIPCGVSSWCFEPVFMCRHLCNFFLNSVWIWIVLTQQFTASIFALNPEGNGPAVHLVSLSNNFVNKSSWIAENVCPVILPPIPLLFWMIYDLFTWDGIGGHFDMYYSVHNFDGHKQKLDRPCSFQTKDFAQCCTHVLQKLMAEVKKHLSNSLLSTPHLILF